MIRAVGVKLKQAVGIRPNRRQAMVLTGLVSLLLLAAICVAAPLIGSAGVETRLTARNLPPSWQHLFGTDWLGRDMLARTVKGLALSLQVGALGAAASALIAAVLGLAAATCGKLVDHCIRWLIDLFLSVPHLVLLILIAFVCGGGMKGIVIGIALTHWPSLARLIRAEAMQVMTADYVRIAQRLGKSRWHVATRHVWPHVLPHVLVGLLLMFPHAILHEAAITFLGLGLSPHEPAIGIILSESMRYLSTGMWWLAVFPGLGLLLVVGAFARIGEQTRLLVDPHHAHE